MSDYETGIKMDKYNVHTKALIVLPAGKPIFSELATTIEIDEEAAGPFVKVSQYATGENVIAITAEEWPHIRAAIDRVFEECAAMEEAGK